MDPQTNDLSFTFLRNVGRHFATVGDSFPDLFAFYFCSIYWQNLLYWNCINIIYIFMHEVYLMSMVCEQFCRLCIIYNW